MARTTVAMCERFGSLPDPGGLNQQDARLLQQMRMVNLYEQERQSLFGGGTVDGALDSYPERQQLDRPQWTVPDDFDALWSDGAGSSEVMADAQQG